MEDGRIRKDIIYGELALGRRTTGRPLIRYLDVCVRDMKAVDIDTTSWDVLEADRTKWRSSLKQHLKTGATSAIETVTPSVVSSATIDAASPTSS